MSYQPLYDKEDYGSGPLNNFYAARNLNAYPRVMIPLRPAAPWDRVIQEAMGTQTQQDLASPDGTQMRQAGQTWRRWPEPARSQGHEAASWRWNKSEVKLEIQSIGQG